MWGNLVCVWWREDWEKVGEQVKYEERRQSEEERERRGEGGWYDGVFGRFDPCVRQQK